MKHQYVLPIGLLGGLLLLLIGVWLLGAASQAVISQNVRVGELDLGGKTVSEAEQLIDQASQQLQEFVVTAGETNQAWQITSDLGIRIDSHDTALAALQLGSHGNRFLTGWNHLKSWFVTINVPATLRVDRPLFDSTLRTLAGGFDRPDRDAQIAYQEGAWHVVPSQAGRALGEDASRKLILQTLSRLETGPIALPTTVIEPVVTTQMAEALLPQAIDLTDTPLVLELDGITRQLESDQLASWIEIYASQSDAEQAPRLHLNEEKIGAYLRTLAQEFNREPVDARVVFRDGLVTITQDSQDGRELNEDQAIKLVAETFTENVVKTIDLPIDLTSPSVSSTTIHSLGLKELIGTATTSYVGSPDNRKHNIANGSKFLTGKLVKPGEEFSVVTALGAVDDTTGYLPELVIKENETTPEFGGGLCQVSTTLFRAALNAGLKITERQNHSYRVSYYERGVGPGLDATIYLPRPDFKFLNDTPGWILVQGGVKTTNDEITFELYGTKDGRRSEISAPTVYDITEAPPAIYVETADLPVGTTKQVEKAHSGAKTIVSYKVYRESELLFEQTFRSTYKAWAPRYLVGTAPVVEELVPEPTETTQASP